MVLPTGNRERYMTELFLSHCHQSRGLNDNVGKTVCVTFAQQRAVGTRQGLEGVGDAAGCSRQLGVRVGYCSHTDQFDEHNRLASKSSFKDVSCALMDQEDTSLACSIP